MYDRPILNNGPIANHDVVDISPDHSVKPERAVMALDHITE